MARSRITPVIGVAAGVFVALAVLVWRGTFTDAEVGPDTDRGRSEPWNLTMVGAPESWSRATGAGVVVAVVDTGADSRHPDLRDRVIGSADCVGAAGDPDRCGDGGDTDLDGHGTHVAGTIAATADNRAGIAGVAPEASLLTIRALVPTRCDRPPCGANGPSEDIAAAVRWAVREGAQVVNLSIGTAPGGGRSELESAIDEAWRAGVAVVVAGPSGAAGTADDDGGLGASPALVVTAVDSRMRPAPYARPLGSPRWAVAAPGGLERATTSDGCSGDDAIRSAQPVPGGASDATGCLVGTSMAAPHVSGALALLIEAGAAPREAVEAVVATASTQDLPGGAELYGAGLLDIPAALDAVTR